MRVLLLHNTQHDLPAVESMLASSGYTVRSVPVNALTLQAEVTTGTRTLSLIASDDAARDVIWKQVCVVSQFRERPIVVFTEDDDPVAMRSAMQARVSAYVVAGLSPKRLRTVIDVALERFRHDQDQYAQLLDARRQANRERVIAQAKALLRRQDSVNPTPMRNCAVRQCDRCTISEIAERLLAGA